MATFPFFQQLGAMDCGPACVQMIARYYGKTVSLSLLREKAQTGKNGVNLLGIQDAAEAVGLVSSAVKLGYDELVAAEGIMPCILYWNQNHFVVLIKKSAHKLQVADPAAGIIKLTPQEFTKRWLNKSSEGVALLLQPGAGFVPDEETRDRNPSMNFRSFFVYILPHRKLFIQLIIALLIGSVVQLIVPFLSQSIVDIGISNKDLQFVYIILLAQLALFAGRLFLDFIRSWILLYISTHINISILSDFLTKLLKLPVSFFDSKNMGDILQRMNDHQRIESFLTGSSLTIIFSVVNLFVFSIVLVIYNLTIFLVFLALSLVYVVWIVLFLKKRKILEYKRFDLAASEHSIAIQMIQGMQEIKINGIEGKVRSKWEEVQASLFRLLFLGQKLNQWQTTGSFFINEGKNIIITFLSAKAVIHGDITLGSMLAIQYVIGQLNSPVEQMISFVQSFQFAKISLDRLNEVHTLEDEEPAGKQLLTTLPVEKEEKELADAPPEPVLNSSKAFVETVALQPALSLRIAEHSEGAIVFSDVSFTYPGAGNEPVLEHINLQIPVGKTTAIVGVSGSGKTTLLKLLLKFYKPGGGEIRYNNVPLDSISSKFWRSSCGVVMQDSFIFSDTIAGNIALGEETIDRKRLEEAAHQANIKEVIESMGQQYDTKIGPDGAGLSMGQKQRILIARAVYRNPEFILFDEATNNLDASNESIILQNLQTFFEKKTVVVVAHRLSTVKNAFKIVVLKNGRLVEEGTHRELVQLKGEYFTLVKNQLELGD